MKHFISILALVLATAFGAHAQDGTQYGYTALGGADGGTYYIAASANTNLGGSAVFTATKYDNFTLALSWKPKNGASNSIDVAWEFSPDGSTWPAAITGNTNSTYKSWFITIGADATNAAGQALFMTNITLNSVGYWRILSVTNNSAVILTNFAARAYYKPKRKGAVQ